MANTPPHFLIVAGESSGDLLGAELIAQLEKHYPTPIDISIVGGNSMRKTAAHCIYDANKLSVVGFIEVLKHYHDIRRAFKIIKQFIRDKLPDMIILIDYPGFNLRLAKFAHQLGIKVLYYVSPQIWAWRYHRIHFIKQYVDHMAVLFPFEENIYIKEGIPCTCVGHPLLKTASQLTKNPHIAKALALTAGRPCIGLFPGSRRSEIKRLLPVMVSAAQTILEKIPSAQFVLPLAPGLAKEDIQPSISNTAIKLTTFNTQDIAPFCDAAITCSGTTTLALALYGVPQVIIYKLNSLTYYLAKKLVKTPYIGLCNIVADSHIAKELIQQAATPEQITHEIETILLKKTEQMAQANTLAQFKIKLQPTENPTTIFVKIIQDMLVSR